MPPARGLIVAAAASHSGKTTISIGLIAALKARGSPVIVMYMAVKHLAHIAASLILGGRAMQEPVAIVAHATTEAQQVLETTLGAAAADLTKSGIEPPAVIVVGNVVRLRAGLDWLGAIEGRALIADPLGLGEGDASETA